jgi:hypothetical protein
MSRLCVIHCLPSAIPSEEYTVSDAFRSCADRRRNEALTDPNARLSAIGPIVCVTQKVVVAARSPDRAQNVQRTEAGH